ncbi:MAG: PAS domain S-box protein [Elusimicrobiales bacterium]|nr:PAS domain S-box protein [Elusimicrobiales bacterium]
MARTRTDRGSETRILDSLKDLILVYGMDGRILYVNDTVCRTLGWERQFLLARSVADLVAAPYKKLLAERIKKLKTEGELTITTGYRRKNGGVFHAETRCDLTRMDGKPCVLCIARGIGHGEKALRELGEARARYRRLVEGLNGEYFFYQHDSKGVFTYVSPSIKNVLGYSQAKFLKHFTQYLSDNPLNKSVFLHTRESLKGNPQPPYRVETLHANGGRRWLEVFEIPVRDPSGRVVSIDGIAHDITAQVKNREELETYRSGLEKLVEERTAELKAVLDRTPVLIVLLDSRLRILRTNAPAQKGGLIGEVLRCVRARVGECGRGKACGSCQVRRAVVGTMNSGKPVSRLEAEMHTKNGKAYFLLSTAVIETAGERQLLICLDDITQQKAAEESLRKSEGFRRLILSSVGDGIIGVDNRGKILFMNEAAESMLGWTLAELSGKNLHNVIHAKRPDGSPYPAEDCPMYAAYSGSKESVIQDEMLWRKDGTGFYVRYSARPMFSGGEASGAVITFSDMTERRLIETELRVTKERLRNHNAALTELGRGRAASGTDTKAAFREAVETAASALEADRVGLWLFNEDHSQLLCRSMYDKAVHAQADCPTLAAADYPAFFRLLERERMLVIDDARSDFRVRDLREGYIKPKNIASILCVAIASGQKVAGVLSAERFSRAAPWGPDEQSLLAAVADFAALAIASSEREKLAGMKDFLTHTIVHDLKNPLSSIIVAAQLLEEDFSAKMNPEQRETLRILNSLSLEMSGMVSNILDINRLEEGKMPLKAALFRPEKLLREAAAGLKMAAEQEKKKIRTRAASGLPELYGDMEMLRRVLDNLLMNAVKFAPPGTEIEAGASAGAEGAEFFVRNLGPGIPPEYHARIFEKFVQIEDPSPRKWAGKGLGLAFCKLAVEAHGGRIWVESPEGRGVVFRFSIPFKRPAPVQKAV